MAIVVTLADNMSCPYRWSMRQRAVVLDARMDEANMLIQLARALSLVVRAGGMIS